MYHEQRSRSAKITNTIGTRPDVAAPLITRQTAMKAMLTHWMASFLGVHRWFPGHQL